jgi:signal transduction histidine kinase
MPDLRRTSEWPTAALLGLLVFVLYAAAGCASIGLTGQGELSPTVWPSSAIALVLMLRCRLTWRDDLAVGLAVLVAAAGFNLMAGLTVTAALAHALTALAALLLQVWLARRYAPLTYSTPAEGWRFALIVGVPAPLLGALATAAIAFQADAPHPLAVGLAWLFAQTLGFLLVAPFGMTISRKEFARLRLPQRAALAVGDFALTAVVAVGVFSQSRYPLLFMLMPPLLLATFHFRLAGAAVGAAVVAVTGLIMTNLGHGPIMLINPGGADRILVLQLFVTLACLTMLPIAAALNQRDRLSAVIERQTRAAIAASEAKSRLLAQVSHEVRTPLSAILNFATFVETGVEPAQLKELAALIGRNGRMLKTLADDLVDLSAHEAGALSIRSGAVQVGDMLNDIRASFGPQAQQAATSILIRPTAALSETVAADPRRYRQILANLTSNAIKYGAGHGPVTMTASHLPDDFLRVEISNGGPGISLERQGELFLPFSRAGAEDTEIDGTGLGLLLTKQLVELQGGRIAFASEPHQRTRFWVDLPLAA